ncbi:LamG domain-containing protein [Fodinicola feengrottensis]
MKAPNESTHDQWKTFDPTSARLNVTYNTVPNAPTDLDAVGKGCASGDSRPFVGETTPTLSAAVSDDDGGQLLSAGIYYGALGSSSFIGSISQSSMRSGTRLTGAVPASQLADGQSYYFQARTNDGIDTGPWSKVCEFTVDTTLPDKIPTVSSTDYPNDDSSHGGVGRTGRFIFGSNGVSDHGVNDIVGYRYSLTSCAPTSATEVKVGTPGSSATVAITPTTRGQATLCVRSEDRAGNVSDPLLYRFYTKSATDPTISYPADEGTGTTVADSSGNNHGANVVNGVSWVSGRTSDSADKALQFDGTSGYGTSSGPALTTNATFTVAAWVKVPAVPTANETVLSQAGNSGTAFSLQYRTGINHWVFAMTATDSDAADVVVADSGVAPVAGTWVHLAGTYDSVKNEARMYVNGTSGPPVTVANSWNAMGPLLIGRSQLAGQPAEFFAGDIDDVRIWDRIVLADELVAMVDSDSQLGRWNFDENTGTTSTDASGRGHDVTLSPGASWIPDRDSFATAMALNGTSGYAQTSGPVIHTDQSFSVAAWVRLDATSSWETFVSQDGVRNSNFYLQYRTDSKKWAFSFRTNDTDTSPVQYVSSDVNPIVGRWTALVGVYDTVARQIRIYVDGTLAGTLAMSSNWNATGSLAIGRGKNGGVLGDYVHGAVDTVEVYSGVLSGRQINDFSVSPNA